MIPARLLHVWQTTQVGTPEGMAVAIFVLVELLARS